MSTVSAVVQPTPVSAKEAPRLRLEFLDGLRGFASLYVVVYHCFLGYNSLTNQLASLPSYWMGKLIKLLYFGLFNFGHEAVVVLSFFLAMFLCYLLPALKMAICPKACGTTLNDVHAAFSRPTTLPSLSVFF